MSDYTTIYLHVDTEPVPNELIFNLNQLEAVERGRLGYTVAPIEGAGLATITIEDNGLFRNNHTGTIGDILALVAPHVTNSTSVVGFTIHPDKVYPSAIYWDAEAKTLREVHVASMQPTC